MILIVNRSIFIGIINRLSIYCNQTLIKTAFDRKWVYFYSARKSFDFKTIKKWKFEFGPKIYFKLINFYCNQNSVHMNFDQE